MTRNPLPITSITLEGFQVFDKPTKIPLDRLTFLFGPNSAGKSAIKDALDFYRAICEVKIHAYGGGVPRELFPLLKRHWRRSNEGSESQVEEMSLSYKQTASNAGGGPFSDNLIGDIGLQSNRKILESPELPETFEMETKWIFYKELGAPIERDSDIGVEVLYKVNNTLLFEFNAGNILRINLVHPIIRSIEKKVDYSAVIEANPETLTLLDGILTITNLRMHIGFINPMRQGVISHRDAQYADNGSLIEDDYELMLKDITELLHATTYITHLDKTRPARIVNASRTIPSRNDLTSMELADDDSRVSHESKSTSGLDRICSLYQDSEYAEFIQSLTTKVRFSEDQSETLGQSPEKYAENVNHALSHHLFLEQGYRFDYDYRIFLSKLNSIAAAKKEALYDEEFTYIYELFLRDGQGRRHFLEDVGSGIGYLLPVLCAVYAIRTSTCFIQQPELHIHPALQSALGDVLIEASKTGPQQLIETHSEHLLLRILKRIRQTHGQVSIADELKIAADDVCVLYFNPSPDGTTTVKRLRITEDGDFMDRWPRGFFTERDQDLFDE